MSNEVNYEGTLDDPRCLPELEDLLLDWGANEDSVELSYFVIESDLAIARRGFTFNFRGGRDFHISIDEDGTIGPGQFWAKHDHLDSCYEVIDLVGEFSSDLVARDEWSYQSMASDESVAQASTDERRKRDSETCDSSIAEDQVDDALPDVAPVPNKWIALSRVQRVVHLSFVGDWLSGSFCTQKVSDAYVTKEDETREARLLRRIYQQRGDELLKQLPANGDAKELAAVLEQFLDEEAREAHDSVEDMVSCPFRGLSDWGGNPLPPALRTAEELVLIFMNGQRGNAQETAMLNMLIQNAYEVSAGLVQAIHLGFDCDFTRACAITQLKRACRGLAVIESVGKSHSLSPTYGPEGLAVLEESVASLKELIASLQKEAWHPPWAFQDS